MTNKPSWWWASTLAVLAFTSAMTTFPYAGRGSWNLIFNVLYIIVILLLIPKLYAEVGFGGVLTALFIWFMGELYVVSPEHDCLYLLGAVVVAGAMASILTEKRRDTQ